MTKHAVVMCYVGVRDKRETGAELDENRFDYRSVKAPYRQVATEFIEINPFRANPTKRRAAIHLHSLTWVVLFGVISLMFLQLPRMVARQDAVVNTYSALVEVDALARQQYVEPIKSHHLVDGAIRGMLLQLDPYSGYIAPDELAAFQRRSGGGYIGVGLEIGVRSGRLIVIAPIEGSPAAAAGVLAGDVIVGIDDHNVEGLSVHDVEELLGGAPGTTVEINVLHSGQVEPTIKTITRGPVSLISVRGSKRDQAGEWEYLIAEDDRIGYVRVSSFRNNTLSRFKQIISDLISQDARGLIIDLRFNPGGVMHQAIDMVDCFVSRGVILSTVTRRKAVQEYLAKAERTLTDIPLVVLINGGSASSSEIVAGALQALDRATIIGTRSFGKGSVQHLIHLSGNKAAIKLTTAYYRMPDGRVIHRTNQNAQTDTWGVIPDIEVKLTDEETHTIQASRRALDTPNPQPQSADASTNTTTDTSAQPQSEIPHDRQLTRAIEHLRGLIGEVQ